MERPLKTRSIEASKTLTEVSFKRAIDSIGKLVETLSDDAAKNHCVNWELVNKKRDF